MSGVGEKRGRVCALAAFQWHVLCTACVIRRYWQHFVDFCILRTQQTGNPQWVWVCAHAHIPVVKV